MRSASIVGLVTGIVLVGACGDATKHPSADRDKSVEQVQRTTKDMSEAQLRAAIDEYEKTIASTSDQDEARKLKDRVKVYGDELTRRSQR